MSPAFPTRFRSAACRATFGAARGAAVFCARRYKRLTYALQRNTACVLPVLIASLCAGALAACGNDDGAHADASDPPQTVQSSQTQSSAASSFNTPLTSQFTEGTNAAPAVQIPPSSIVETPAQTPAEADAAASGPLAPPVIHTVD
ncbi:MAG: hypothetical protein ACREXZ_09885 [Paraburkholderia sp.]